MIALGAIAARWKLCLALGAVLAFAGLAAAVIHYRQAARAQAAARAADHAAYRAAQAQATRLAAEAIHHQEAVYRMKAAQQDHAHETELVAARAAGAAFGLAHRLQPQTAGGARRPAPAATTGDSAGLRAAMPAAGVVVSEQDVQACSEVTAFALSLRAWALELERLPAEQ